MPQKLIQYPDIPPFKKFNSCANLVVSEMPIGFPTHSGVAPSAGCGSCGGKKKEKEQTHEHQQEQKQDVPPQAAITPRIPARPMGLGRGFASCSVKSELKILHPHMCLHCDKYIEEKPAT